MKVVPIADLDGDLKSYLEQCRSEGPIVITEGGKTVAVLLTPRDDEDLERLLLGRSPEFQSLLDRSRHSIEAGRGLSAEEFWRAVEERHAGKERSGRRSSR